MAPFAARGWASTCRTHLHSCHKLVLVPGLKATGKGKFAALALCLSHARGTAINAGRWTLARKCRGLWRGWAAIQEATLHRGCSPCISRRERGTAVLMPLTFVSMHAHASLFHWWCTSYSYYFVLTKGVLQLLRILIVTMLPALASVCDHPSKQTLNKPSA